LPFGFSFVGPLSRRKTLDVLHRQKHSLTPGQLIHRYSSKGAFINKSTAEIGL
jgi:hypothetical protein